MNSEYTTEYLHFFNKCIYLQTAKPVNRRRVIYDHSDTDTDDEDMEQIKRQKVLDYQFNVSSLASEKTL